MTRVQQRAVGFVISVLVVLFVLQFFGWYFPQHYGPSSTRLVASALYIAVAAMGLNVLTGYTGQISLGHGAFMAIGGYTTALLMSDHGIQDVYTIPLAVVVAGIVGVLFGFDLNFNNWIYYLSWTVALVGYVIAWLILRGRTGRSLRAVRDSETAAVSSGVGLTHAKVFAFGVSAAYAGAAGALFAIATNFVNPDTFPVTLSIFLLVGVVVGGLGSLTGLIVGAVFIQFMPLWAQNISKSPGAPAVVYGVILILVVLALPTGAAGLFDRLAQLARRGRDFQKP